MTATILSSPPDSIESIRHQRKRRVVAVVYCAFGDESRDGSKGRVYAVAGMFGHQDEWDALELQWKARLDGRTFHAVDCESDHGDFAISRPEGHAENQNLYRDLVGIIKKHRGIVGHGIAVNVADYNKAFPDDPEHAPYVWGFGGVVQMACDLAYLSVPPGEVKVVFDKNEELEFGASEMYRYLIGNGGLKARGNLFGEIAFACRRTVGVQVADLVARETMKHLDNRIGPVSRPVRRSMQSLMENSQLKFEQYDYTKFDEMKQGAPRNPMAAMAQYRSWLAVNGLADCLTNQIRHIREYGTLWDNRP